MKKISVFVFILLFTITGFGLQNTAGDKASEDKEIAKTNDSLKRAFLYIKFANRRIHLIQKKEAKGKLKAKGKSEELYPLINEYRENIDKAYGEIMKAQALGRDTSSSINVVNQATSKHIEVLNKVLGKVPEKTKRAIKHAIEDAWPSVEGMQAAMHEVEFQGAHGRIKFDANGDNEGASWRPVIVTDQVWEYYKDYIAE